ncbi:MAG: wax ester/triacylglycerol synthase family O-acyltransferase [Myxococcales bacterium]|nr:wax ester/triacylglycerol synthase family O-acyltransferase [Myxococcales bacterium]MCB9577398.1 wax ester/triacylglycerol synthase family O-acyltransferase [Polyangiaceae bacterium]
MSHHERLSALDCGFLYAESPTAQMHVGSLTFFKDPGLTEKDVFEHIESRLHLVPRFRQKVRWVPGSLHRPVWVDDPHFDLRFHVRWTGLPRPAGEREALALMGRVQSRHLDRRKPLWEMWIFEMPNGRLGLIQKTHHCMIDGVSGVDLGTVLLDLSADAPKTEPAPWNPDPEPTDAELAGDALRDLGQRPSQIRDLVRRVRDQPEKILDRASEVVKSMAAFGKSAAELAPRTLLNAPIGPHRRFEVVRMALSDVKRIKNAHGCTVNDVVLALVSGGLRRLLLSRSEDVDGLSLKAMVPVSVRDPSARGTWGNQVSMMAAELPVGEADPVVRLAQLREAMRDLKEKGQAVGADFWVKLGEFAPPTLLSLAGRGVALQRMVNVVVTNVPGPQFPLYLRGGQLLEAFPYVPIFANNPVGVAVLSYNGQLNFGLTGDWDLVPDLNELAEGIAEGLAELDGAS